MSDGLATRGTPGSTAERVLYRTAGLGGVLAVGSMVVLRGVRSTWASVGHTCGVLAGGAWILLAGWFAALYTSVGEALGEATTDASAQQVALHVHNIGATGITLAASLGFACWLVSLLAAGRSTGVIGMPLAILATVTALALLQPFLMPFTPPWGVLGTPAFCLVAGVTFLLRARQGKKRTPSGE